MTKGVCGGDCHPTQDVGLERSNPDGRDGETARRAWNI